MKTVRRRPALRTAGLLTLALVGIVFVRAIASAPAHVPLPTPTGTSTGAADGAAIDVAATTAADDSTDRRAVRRTRRSDTGTPALAVLAVAAIVAVATPRLVRQPQGSTLRLLSFDDPVRAGRAPPMRIA